MTTDRMAGGKGRLLVLAMAPFGDAALLVEPLAALRSRKPGLEITVAATEGVCDVLRHLRLADELWEIGPSPTPAPVLFGLYRTSSLLWRSHRHRFHAVIDLFPTPRTMLARRLATPGGPISRDRKLVDTLFNVKRNLLAGHDPLDRIARLLDVELGESALALGSDAESDEWVERTLTATGYRGGEPIVVLHSEGNWPESRLVEMAGRLRSDVGTRIVVVDTPREGRRAKRLAGELGGSVLAVSAPPAGRFIGFLARASLVVTDDMGAAYLAGLTETPVLYITVASRGLPSLVGRRELTAPTLDQISVDEAFSAACKLVGKERTGSLFRR